MDGADAYERLEQEDRKKNAPQDLGGQWAEFVPISESADSARAQIKAFAESKRLTLAALANAGTRFRQYDTGKVELAWATSSEPHGQGFVCFVTRRQLPGGRKLHVTGSVAAWPHVWGETDNPQRVLICEGQTDGVRLVGLDPSALVVALPTGVLTWKPAWKRLVPAGLPVHVLFDNPDFDEPMSDGKKASDKGRAKLLKAFPLAKTLWPEDVSDWCEWDGTPEEFVGLLDEIPVVEWDDDLAGLLDDTVRVFKRFIAADQAVHVFQALWVAHTWSFEAAEITPYNSISSATRRCGKTTLLKLLSLLARNPDLLTNPTDAILYRIFALHAGPPTLIFDEFDRTLRNPKDRQDLISMLNAGNEEGATIPRTAGSSGDFHVERFPVYCPKAFGSIGDINDEATLDRSVTCKLRRKRKDERVQRARRRAITAATRPVVARFAAWRKSGAVRQLKDIDVPDIVDLDDRAMDFWESLLAIADLAGGRWPGLAREAALELSAGRDLADDSLDVDLLRRCYAAFHPASADGPLDELHTVDLVASICADDDSPWRRWWWDDKDAKPAKSSGADLAWRLKRFGIAPEEKPFRVEGMLKRGYLRGRFEDVWKAYSIGEIPATPPNARNTRNSDPQTRMVDGKTAVTGTRKKTVPPGLPVTAQTRMVDPKNSDVTGVTGKSGGGGESAVPVDLGTARLEDIERHYGDGEK